MRLAVLPHNPTVGDIDGSATRILNARAEARAADADLLITPELSILGYPAEDLVLKPAVQAACRDALHRLTAASIEPGPAMIVGAPFVRDGALVNGAFLLDEGAIVGVTVKRELPNYGPFDEKRVFQAGPEPTPFAWRGTSLGVPICEDMWFSETPSALARGGAEMLIAPNASPFRAQAAEHRRDVALARARETGRALLFVNQLGGQDELVFDGGPFVVEPDGGVAAQARPFDDSLQVFAFRRDGGNWRLEEGPTHNLEPPLQRVYRALVLGLRDYVRKNGFRSVLLGLSGGIDSAMTAAIAVDALGPDAVHAVMLPSAHTSQESVEDAEAAAQRLGVRLDTVSIEGPFDAALHGLAPLFGDRPLDVAEENLQSRMRGVLLMAISNKLGPLLLTTGNKSENAVGYATLYGDMSGGYNVLKDVYKTKVFALAALRNQWRPEDAKGPDGAVIPERIITKPPTAELRPDQKDTDSLPPYEILDPILEALIEGDESVNAIVAHGFDSALVAKVERMVYAAEYKRRQAAPGVKVTERMFGRDRRYPIVNAFRTA